MKKKLLGLLLISPTIGVIGYGCYESKPLLVLVLIVFCFTFAVGIIRLTEKD